MTETPELYNKLSPSELDAYAGNLNRERTSLPPTVYEARTAGREFCQTEGSDHYRRPGPEPMDLIIAAGYAEGFCLGSAIKYIDRYYRTRDKEDLKKAADMIHIYCGL